MKKKNLAVCSVKFHLLTVNVYMYLHRYLSATVAIKSPESTMTF